MPVTLEYVHQLIEDREQESSRLEFKRCDALAKDDRKRSELVKDVTGLANGSGGRIIYGIAEEVINGIGVAGSLSPITDPKITKEWVTQVLAGNVSPSLKGVEIHEIGCSNVSVGRVLVVDVKESTTAHQNLIDKRYYQRTSVATEPMLDFQIRDVMNRRVTPLVDVNIKIVARERTSERHRYVVCPVVTNVGAVTLERWRLELDVPSAAAANSLDNHVNPFQRYTFTQVRNVAGVAMRRISVGDPLLDGSSLVLHPAQSVELGRILVPEILLTVNNDIYTTLGRAQCSLDWKVYLMNSHPQSGSVPFSEWCSF